MSRWTSLYNSTVGKKIIVALTGAILLGFLCLHVAGNLKVFLPDPAPGVADIDVYSRFLRSMGAPIVPHGAALWTVRVVLAAALILHMTLVLQLALRNRRSRPLAYAMAKRVRASLASRSMMYTGLAILFFVIVHLLQFTIGAIDPAQFVKGAVYGNLHRVFQNGYWVLFYLIAVAFVAIHLHHGAWSLFQTLGLDNPDRNRGLRTLAFCLSIVVFLGFASIPISFFSGILASPPR